MAEGDLRIKRTKTLLKRSFEDLFLSVDYEKISVKELCEKASISRRTFYLHYDTIDDLLSEILDEVANDFLENTSGYDHFANPDRMVRDFFYFTNENKIFEKCNCKLNYDYIKNMITSKVFANDKYGSFKSIEKYDLFTQRILGAYLNGACVAIYRTWYSTGKIKPIDEVIKTATLLIKEGINSMAKEL